MSISNHAELVTAVSNYLHRSDLNAMIPDFISLAEAKLNRRLRLRAMENTSTGSVAQSVSLPTGYVEMRSMSVTSGSTYYPIPYITPSSITEATGAPSGYSIVWDNIIFNPYESSYSYKMTYYKKFDALSSGVNWLITNAPDVYLYATLLEATPYIQDDNRLPIWLQALNDVIGQLSISDNADRFGSSLQVKAA